MHFLIIAFKLTGIFCNYSAIYFGNDKTTQLFGMEVT